MQTYGHFSKDKFFDMSWFYPEFFRFRWVLLLHFSYRYYQILVVVADYIQPHLDKVLGYGATETLMF